MAERAKRPVTYADLEAVPEHLVAEIIAGKLVVRSHGHFRPAMVRTALSYALRTVGRSRSNPNALWQVATLPELHLGGDIMVPEIAAWRIERLPFLPDAHVDICPDWVCELKSHKEDTNPALELKLARYAKQRVNHAWIVHTTERRLDVMHRDDGRWMLGGSFSGFVANAPPFDAISFSLADLWPLDKPLGFNEDPTPLYAGDR